MRARGFPPGGTREVPTTNGSEPFGERVERLRSSSRWELAKARAPRWALISACAILSLAGLKEIVVGDPSRAARMGAPEGGDPAMRQFATAFARAYLTYDAGAAEAREAALGSFVPEYLSADAGFEPARGRQAVLWAEVAQDQEAIAGGRIITVAAQTDRDPDPLYLAVPVRRLASGELVLASFPAYVGAPAVALAVSEPLRDPVDDAELAAMAERVAANYLAGAIENLRADLAPQATVSLPPVALELDAVDELVWADAPGGEAVLATLSAIDRGSGAYSLTYEIGVIKRGGRWYARWIEVIPTSR